MNNKKLLFASILIGCWLFSTLFIDFFLIKTIFRTAEDLFLAGKIGLSVFGAFNPFEFIFGFTSLILVWKGNPFIRSLLISVVCLSLFYWFYMTPKIGELTLSWETTLAQNLPISSQYQEEQQMWHSRYIFFDTVKIIILIISEILIIQKILKEPLHDK